MCIHGRKYFKLLNIPLWIGNCRKPIPSFSIEMMRDIRGVDICCAAIHGIFHESRTAGNLSLFSPLKQCPDIRGFDIRSIFQERILREMSG